MRKESKERESSLSSLTHRIPLFMCVCLLGAAAKYNLRGPIPAALHNYKGGLVGEVLMPDPATSPHGPLARAQQRGSGGGGGGEGVGGGSGRSSRDGTPVSTALGSPL